MRAGGIGIGVGFGQSGESFAPTPPDVTAPVISSVFPADNEINVSSTGNLTATFSEPVVFGTSGSIILRDNDGGFADLETFLIPGDIGTGAGKVSISGSTLTINPTSAMAFSIPHAVRISATAIEDLAGNPFAGIADDTTWSFTVEASPTPAPTLTLESYVGDDLTISTDLAGTGFWKWSASSTPLTGAAIEAAPDGTAAFPVGIIDQVIADPGPGTWYLNIVNKNAAGYSNVITVEEIVPALGWTFTEDWSTYTVGNGWTELDVAYSRSATMVGAIVTDADGPAGKGCDLTTSSVGGRFISRDDITSQLALRTTERVQFLFKVRASTLASSRNALGMIGTNLAWGASFFRDGTGWNIATILNGDYTASPPTNKTDIVTAQSDSDLFYIRVEIDGVDVKARMWEPPASEGGTWTTLTAGAAVAVTNCGLAVRTNGAASYRVLGYSVGIISDAPSF